MLDITAKFLDTFGYFANLAALAWRLYEAIAVDGNERNGSCSATAGIFQDLFEQSDDGVIGFMEQWP